MDLVGIEFKYVVPKMGTTTAVVDMYDPEIGFTAVSKDGNGEKKIIMCYVLPGSPKFLDQEIAWQKDSQECVDYVVDAIESKGEVILDELYKIQQKYTNRDVRNGESPDENMCAFS